MCVPYPAAQADAQMVPALWDTTANSTAVSNYHHDDDDDYYGLSYNELPIVGQ